MSVRAPNLVVGVAFMLLGVSVLPAMNTLAKSLAAEFPVWQVVWARFFGHLLWMTILFWPKRGWNLFVTTRPREHFLRSGIFMCSNVAFITALPLVSLPLASAVMFTVPLLVTALSVPLLSERVGPWRWSAVLVGFAGVLVIIQPGSDLFNIGTLFVLGSAGCFSLYQITTRKLASYAPADTLIVYTALVGAVVTTLILPWVGVRPESWSQVLAFAGIGLLGGVGQLCIIKALQNGPASVISPFGYAEIISATIFGYFVFGDFPDRTTWYGAGLIIASGLVIVYRETVRRRRN